ncbi:ATP-dependent RNA helicase DBP7 [Vanrija pseudolonga]|uniref:ATP-dependent RNA helicase n=1 Tax=Vanrija pseudolonga TaxID=143232 RepID=A0AAF1BTP6_9TREE|nr:ATP-dependent RNA helicase DBP7 [Vanrija pseudolonga]WOO85048.1 ATP-dependent RNA helicase DBP7 [Vanrija pseudolonga]WOO85049.1 ATP-dependent RNA helicase DBP7 [Vanrija pseudolonga]
MDDGGIELNFSVPDGGNVRRQLAPKKGGRWTDRVKAKQAARRVVKKYESGNAEPATTRPVGQPPVRVPPPPPAPRPAPAPKPATAAPVARPAPAPVSRPKPQPAPKAAPAPRAAPSAEAGPSRLPMEVEPKEAPAPKAAAAPAGPQIVSSLFTSNPNIGYVKQSIEPVLGAPSNAPLIGDTNTFAGLGLDPLLVHHLQNKMAIKAPTGIQKSALPHMLSSPLDISARREEDEEGFAKPVADEGPRDVFIQSQTGSGKTLSFLLPIIQTLLPLSKLSYIDRSIGTLAIILAPTRELAQQISQVLENILRMALSLPDDEEDRGYTRWLVSGLLVGGSTRTHEKAKLRKGVPIIVSTPGRLLDHLQNTASFQTGKCMFLVLDEADRLMDLGFEETIQGIIKAMDGRRRNEIAAEREMDEEGGGLMRWPYWPRGRQTVLCSATVDAKVERLAGMALRDPILFRSSDVDMKEKKKTATDDKVADALKAATAITLPETSEKFTPPSQLAQKYVVTPAKLRLVTLVALLRSLVGNAAKIHVEGENDGTKVIVFLSSTDAVDYHYKLLGGASMGGPEPKAEEAEEDDDSDDDNEDDSDDDDDDDDSETTDKAKSKTKPKPKAKAKAADDPENVTLRSALLPNTTIQRLHGSLPLKTRLASLKAFATPAPHASILFATSVASRGLDLPLVRAVVQYDLPTEGGASEYVHRVGRTARAGKGGEAWAFVAPSETEWVPWVESKMGAAEEVEGQDGGSVRLTQVGVNEVLRRGFGGRGHEYEQRATDVQLAFERWVLGDDQNAALARKAFSSFIRAYSTHPLEERRFFHVKSLHLGHLAKSFALREAPGTLAATVKPAKAKITSSATSNKRKRGGAEDEDDEPRGGKETTARNETERRMYEAVRKQGRLVKSGGTLGAYSGERKGGKSSAAATSGEFQTLDTSELEKLVAKARR